MRSMLRWASAPSKSTISTRAPSSAKRRAVAPPIPRAPPVTIATWSASRCMGNLVSYQLVGDSAARLVDRDGLDGLVPGRLPMTPPLPSTIAEAGAWLRDGRISSVHLTQHLLARSKAAQDTI